ncbi:hypothetical protein KI387_038668, partial [Taxus chinensis]
FYSCSCYTNLSVMAFSLPSFLCAGVEDGEMGVVQKNRAVQVKSVSVEPNFSWGCREEALDCMQQLQ